MRRTISATFFAVLFAACDLGPGAFQHIDGSGRIVSESREATAFSKVQIAGAIKATVKPGPTSVKVTADDNLMQYLETEVDGDVLRVGPRDLVSLDPSKAVEVEIFTPALTAASASGASKITAEVGRTERFDLSASGASHIDLSGLDCSAVAASASGASHLQLSGSVTELGLQLSGASIGRMAQLAADTASVSLSGASDAEIVAASSVTGSLSGASRLHVGGSPAQRSVSLADGCTVDYR